MDALARLLEYPRPGFEDLLGECPAFAAAVAGESLESLQELYTRTFDLNPECSLEIGWHLFGEEYERGAFLVKMRQELRRYGIPESTELPDHLTHALRLAARMAAEDARVFSSRFILPALEKMLAAMEGKGNPYRNVLEAVRAALAQGVAQCPALT
jgi:nitrate reductase delta subunit